LPEVRTTVPGVFVNTITQIGTGTEVVSADNLRFKFLGENYNHILNMNKIALYLLSNGDNTPSSLTYSYKVISFINNSYIHANNIHFNNFLGYSWGISSAYKPFFLLYKLKIISLPVLVPIVSVLVGYICNLFFNRIRFLLNINTIISNCILYLIKS